MFEILSRRSWVWLQPVVVFFLCISLVPSCFSGHRHALLMNWWLSIVPQCQRPALSLDDLGAAQDTWWWEIYGCCRFWSWKHNMAALTHVFSLFKKVLFFVLFFCFGLHVKRLHYISCVKYIVSTLLKKEMHKLPKTLCRNQLLFQMSWFCF